MICNYDADCLLVTLLQAIANTLTTLYISSYFIIAYNYISDIVMLKFYIVKEDINVVAIAQLLE